MRTPAFAVTWVLQRIASPPGPACFVLWPGEVLAQRQGLLYERDIVHNDDGSGALGFGVPNFSVNLHVARLTSSTNGSSHEGSRLYAGMPPEDPGHPADPGCGVAVRDDRSRAHHRTLHLGKVSHAWSQCQSKVGMCQGKRRRAERESQSRAVTVSVKRWEASEAKRKNGACLAARAHTHTHQTKLLCAVCLSMFETGRPRTGTRAL